MRRIPTNRFWQLLIIPGIMLLAACGGGEDNPVGAVEPDVPGKHLVMIKNQTEFMWVGTNTDSIGALMEQYANQKAQYWIGGAVVPDAGTIHNFYFHPNTVQIADTAAEDMQATIDGISRDPQYHALNGEPSEYADHTWFVLGEFLAYQPGEE